MCGVLGIKGEISLKSAQSLLQLLVHRGQDASGLAWLDHYNVHQTEKIKGPPISIGLTDDMVKLVIGSTRYPTLGDRSGNINKKKFAQPFSYQTKVGTLSLCHNGNITNLSEFTENPSQYQSDAEYITKFLGEQINQSGSLKEALIRLSKTFDGAYSIVGMLGDELFCFRDPRGIRPLVRGYNGMHYVFSSESITLQQAGVSEIIDVAPGEFVRVKGDEVVSERIADTEKIAHCYFEYVYFASSVSTINGKNVYTTRLGLGEQLAKQLVEKGIDQTIDYIVPIPDTSKAAAETVSEQLGIPLREGIMKNRSSSRTFIMPSEDVRKNAAKSKYLFVDNFLKGKNILLIDDSIVRGLTMKMLITILRERGVQSIHVAIPCPPQRFPCYYGVDFGTDEELIARNNKTEEEICSEIGADSLTYLSIGNLRNAIGLNNICDACLTGNYPTPYGSQIRLKVLNGELDQRTSHYET